MNKTLKNQNFLSFFAGVIIIFYLSLGFVPNLSACGQNCASVAFDVDYKWIRIYFLSIKPETLF